MKAGIVIDSWKAPIFEQYLSQLGYTYEIGPGLTPETMLLTVTTDSLKALATVVRAANTEAALTGART